MKLNLNRKLVAVAAVAALAVAGGGTALAAAKADSSPQAESKAVIADAATRLGVSSDKLSQALTAAMVARLDAAVAAGKLTRAQADRMKTELESGNVPLLGVRGGGLHGNGHGTALADAASYLGVTEAALRTELEGGKTLAAVAVAQGKTAGGLVDALVAGAKTRLDAEVASGRITAAQEASRLTEIRQRTTELVNGNGRASHGDGRRPAF